MPPSSFVGDIFLSMFTLQSSVYANKEEKMTTVIPSAISTDQSFVLHVLDCFVFIYFLYSAKKSIEIRGLRSELFQYNLNL